MNEMTKHDLDRIEELKRLGFEVVECGFRNTHGEHVTSICYWRHMRGRRVSALHPNPDAAWLDAIRTYEEAEDKVATLPNVHRVESMPADEAKKLSILKRRLLERGFTFSKEDMPDCDPLEFHTYSHFWKRGGTQVGMFKSHADAIKDAIKIWARDEPEDFIDVMNQMSTGNMTGVTSLTGEDLRELQDKGLFDLPLTQQKMVIESQMLMKHMAQRGIKVDTNLGKSAAGYKRAYGVVQGSEEEGKLRCLECLGYQFYFTSSVGWKCDAVPEATGALEAVVKAAWAQVIATGADEEDMLATARAYQIDGMKKAGTASILNDAPAKWDGVGQPPVGTTLWVNPHNTLWGFSYVGDHLCKVLAYYNDYVWLEHLGDMGEATHVFISTRTDKVDCRVWKGNNDA